MGKKKKMCAWHDLLEFRIWTASMIGKVVRIKVTKTLVEKDRRKSFVDRFDGASGLRFLRTKWMISENKQIYN